jgi:hypothetical protein
MNCKRGFLHCSGFWAHEHSRLIHWEGWAKTVGHRILYPTATYNPDSIPFLKSSSSDAEYEALGLKVGMKLEAIDPLNLSAICAATIKKVLVRGYVMVRMDSYEEEEEDSNSSSGADWFCYHISSQSIFPCGFCAENGIVFNPPIGYDDETFDWDSYFEETCTKAARIPRRVQI